MMGRVSLLGPRGGLIEPWTLDHWTVPVVESYVEEDYPPEQRGKKVQSLWMSADCNIVHKIRQPLGPNRLPLHKNLLQHPRL
jgi:hypothetical protein